MSNKNLLNESTIRKFMKLASIEPLASDFISKIQESEEELEEGYGKKEDIDESEEELEEGHGKKPHDEDKMEEGQEEEMDEANCGSHNRDDKMEEELDIDEMGGGMMYKDDDDLGGDDKMLNMNDFLDILEKAVEEFLGEPTDIERDEEPADDMEMDMEMDAEEGDMEMDMELDAEEGDEDPLEEEDLAEAIYKQVLKRLSK